MNIEQYENEIEKISKLIDDEVSPKAKASRLLNAGYGNIRQAVKEFAGKVKEKFWWFDKNTIYIDEEWLTISDLVDRKVDELIKELYGE